MSVSPRLQPLRRGHVIASGFVLELRRWLREGAPASQVDPQHLPFSRVDETNLVIEAFCSAKITNIRPRSRHGAVFVGRAICSMLRASTINSVIPVAHGFSVFAVRDSACLARRETAAL
jgi:hypothetical protein